MIAVADAIHLPLADRSVDLVCGSPPYCDARWYGDKRKHARGAVEWVQWMLEVTVEALRVCRGQVIWVAAGVTRDRNYWPACEGLMWEWFRRGGDCTAYRPVYWHRHGIPGSGGDQWFKATIEYCMCFKRPGPLPWSDNTAMGHPPKYGPGGEMSYRNGEGTRRNQWGGSASSMGFKKKNGEKASGGPKPSHVITTNRDVQEWGRGGRMLETRSGDAVRVTGRGPHGQSFSGSSGRRPNGERKTITIPRDGQHDNEQAYEAPVLANPGNLIHTRAGGGHLGSKLAHENEAPYPEAVPEFFIRSLCPPGGMVLDPFGGSGTTAAVAIRHGRRAISCDIRSSQAEITTRRLAEVQMVLL